MVICLTESFQEEAMKRGVWLLAMAVSALAAWGVLHPADLYARAPGVRLFCAIKHEGGGWMGVDELHGRGDQARAECDAYSRAISAARSSLRIPGPPPNATVYVCLQFGGSNN